MQIHHVGFDEAHDHRTSESKIQFSLLPSELKANVLSYLPTNEIIHFGLVSRLSYELVVPYLSDSISSSNNNSNDNAKSLIEHDIDEYSIDIWTEMINRLSSVKKDRIGTLKDCKKLFLKTFLEKRVCRVCHKVTHSFEEFKMKSIVKSCYCDGYVCRKPCWNSERLANESVSSCSKCGFEYQFTKPEKIGMIPKVFSRYPISSRLVLTTVSSLSCIIFVYLIIAAMGYCIPFHSESSLWLGFKDFWIFKRVLPGWIGFVNGMSIISLFATLFFIIVEIYNGDFGNVDYNTVEGFMVIIPIIVIIATPYYFGSAVKKAVLKQSIYGCPLKAPKKKDLEH